MLRLAHLADLHPGNHRVRGGAGKRVAVPLPRPEERRRGLPHSLQHRPPLPRPAAIHPRARHRTETPQGQHWSLETGEVFWFFSPAPTCHYLLFFCCCFRYVPTNLNQTEIIITNKKGFVKKFEQFYNPDLSVPGRPGTCQRRRGFQRRSLLQHDHRLVS